MGSILTSIKKLLGIERDYDHFNDELVIHINSAFSRLTQLGVGPKNGYFILDGGDAWADYLVDRKDLESVKTYVYLKTKLVFDPPAMSYLIEEIRNQIKELEWTLNVQMEGGAISG